MTDGGGGTISDGAYAPTDQDEQRRLETLAPGALDLSVYGVTAKLEVIDR
jgi:hypothetical protein